MNSKYQLVADIGGTNARFAVCEEGSAELHQIKTFECAQFASPIEIIENYLSDNHLTIESACLGVAGPVNEAEDRVNLTNNTWSFSRDQIVKQFKLERLEVINDFVAAAMAATVASPSDLFLLSEGPTFNPDRQRCILGPGTGLGVAGICSHQGKTLVISTEGGNRSFSPENEIEDYILRFLRTELEIVSCEELISGRGLVNIYRALCSYYQQTVTYRKASDITAAALKHENMAQKALHVFFEVLGSFAGDCALTFGATGGVYIGGGIAPKFQKELLESNFRKRFESKLHYEPYLKEIPTAILMHPYPGLLGAATHLNNL